MEHQTFEISSGCRMTRKLHAIWEQGGEVGIACRPRTNKNGIHNFVASRFIFALFDGVWISRRFSVDPRVLENEIFYSCHVQF